MAAAGEIDEDLHSRQLAVYGRESMRKLAGATVLICGMKGLGAEIAKNVILAGVKAVTIQDASACELADLGAQFYLTEADVGKNRAEACAAKLQELNPAVAVTANTGEITDDLCKQHTVSPAEISEIPNDKPTKTAGDSFAALFPDVPDPISPILSLPNRVGCRVHRGFPRQGQGGGRLLPRRRRRVHPRRRSRRLWLALLRLWPRL
jgi:hypothetical protein